MQNFRWPIVIYLGLMLPVAWFDLDWKLANFWFSMQGGEWFLKSHWLTQAILHDRAHDLVVILYVMIVLLYLASMAWQPLKQYRHGLSYLSLSLPAATLSVSLIKHITQIDCPWSVSDFGGVRDYQFWLQSLWSPVAEAGHCFPAAHASSAYMFFGLYFFSRHFWPSRSTMILFAVIAAGIVFGIAQQLRGAHFISHDLTSALICWYVTLVLWRHWQKRFFTAAES